VLPQLWHRPAAAALIQPSAQEFHLPYKYSLKREEINNKKKFTYQEEKNKCKINYIENKIFTF